MKIHNQVTLVPDFHQQLSIISASYSTGSYGLGGNDLANAKLFITLRYDKRRFNQ